jgi:hypothetical protein
MQNHMSLAGDGHRMNSRAKSAAIEAMRGGPRSGRERDASPRLKSGSNGSPKTHDGTVSDADTETERLAQAFERASVTLLRRAF